MSENIQGDKNVLENRFVIKNVFYFRLELKLLFALFDTDNSGTLTREELKLLLQSPTVDESSISEEKVVEYLNAADTDGEKNRRRRC